DGVLAHPAVDAAHTREVLAVPGRALHDTRESQVGEYVTRGDIERFGRLLTPRRDHLGDAPAGAAELPRTLDAPPPGLPLAALTDARAALLALVGRPFEPSHGVQAFDQRVVEREQVFDVGGGVRALFRA